MTNYSILERNILYSVEGMEPVAQAAFQWAVARGVEITDAEKITRNMQKVGSLVNVAIKNGAGGVPLSEAQATDLVRYMRDVYTRAVLDGRMAA